MLAAEQSCCCSLPLLETQTPRTSVNDNGCGNYRLLIYAAAASAEEPDSSLQLCSAAFRNFDVLFRAVPGC